MTIRKQLVATALFSDDMKYRYSLSRQWDDSKGAVLFVMLNPSTATEEVLDPTVKRCYDFAHRWGYGAMFVGNIFALRSTNPKELYKEKDPVGAGNNNYLMQMHKESAMTILAWGEHGTHLDRGTNVYNYLKGFPPKDLYCLKTTKSGQPMHPLYIKGDTEPIVYKPPKTIQDYK